MRKRIIMITGASSGFGKIFAGMAAEKFQCIDEFWLVGRDEGRLLAVSEEISTPSKIIPCDLADVTALKKLKELLEEEKPTVKMLVNAAGFGVVGHVENQDEKDLMGMLDVNCRALTYLTKVALPYMAYNGRIINFASVAAFMPQPSFAVYAASKSYVMSFTRALNCELKYRKISATAVCPGPAATNFFGTAEEKGGVKAGFYKELFMVEPEPVVKKALRDAIVRKEVSVYSLPMKGLHILTKVLPRKLIFGFLK